MGVTEVRCHTILLAARYKRAHPALTPASGTRCIDPGGMEGRDDQGALITRESNPRLLDRKPDAQTVALPRHPKSFASFIQYSQRIVTSKSMSLSEKCFIFTN